jgi:diaminopimelate decarboxylase
MDSFSYRDGELHCDGISIAKIAASVGTPFYLYSAAVVERNYRLFENALAGVPHLTCFAVKANSNLAVLRLLRDLGSGFDIVSRGELYRLREVGADPQRILFSGVGKIDEELQDALQEGILQFNVESEAELERLNAFAGGRSAAAAVALRVNPAVDSGTHDYISTGLPIHKFGIPMDRARRIYAQPGRYPHLTFTGVSCHIGSQITALYPFEQAVTLLSELVLEVREQVTTLRFVDIGGGLGIRYQDEQPPSVNDYAKAVCRRLVPLDLTLLLEPGRRIVGEAGILVTRVVLTKESGAQKFVVVDAGMTDLIRPTLYGAFHAIEPVREWRLQSHQPDLGGRHRPCRSSDQLRHL